MSFQKLMSTLLFLAISTVNAQNIITDSFDENSLADMDLSVLSKKHSFNSIAVHIAQYEADIAENNTNVNFMTTETVNSEELAEELNMMLFRRHPMEKTGRILTYVGVPLAIIGGIMVAGADELSYQCVNGECTGDARGGFGVVLLGAGVGLSGTGTVLWILGSKK